MLTLQLKVKQNPDFHSESGSISFVHNLGPLRNTIAHFWRMIWEKKIMGIIMLTETVEAGRVSDII